MSQPSECCCPKDAALARPLADLQQATSLIEAAAFDLAERVPSDLVAELMIAAAKLDRLVASIGPAPELSKPRSKAGKTQA